MKRTITNKYYIDKENLRSNIEIRLGHSLRCRFVRERKS